MNNLFDYLDKIFEEAGFSKKGKKNWWLRYKEALIMSNFQKSKYDEAGFLNFGIYFDSLSKTDQYQKSIPKFEDCQVEGRFEGILEDQNFIGLFPLNIDSKSDNELMEYSSSNFNKVILPYLKSYCDLDKIKSEVRNGSFEYNRLITSI